ncbi:hypothetical protein FPQ18DRAFT_326877 [Pyronema domesticum]|uniref:Rhodopsin domain-containing protein n=1 Tax=Pyronema omphalodes (strain CBS 100304) TaxID=1076935 RepID=U4L9V7_PYROM|nr:hypothetical protein FPQ18DRAFT_326877 [Pyronema domesticum]CCX15969.1 Similar to hypothetical protein AOL_s00210g385 [Arthrobotrys oligospora ATCC 24927]; acc. no. EGX43938 [Pyronema omphalodes CBS 100304]
MGIGAHDARMFFVGCVVIQSIITLCLPLRFFLLRKGWRKSSMMAMWSDAFFMFGWLIMMGWGWFDVYLVAMEVAVREKATTQLEIDMFFNTELMAKVYFTNVFIVITAIWALKAAFLCMYGDLYSRIVNIRMTAFHFTVGYVFACFITLIVCALLECRPISSVWDMTNAENEPTCSPFYSYKFQLTMLILGIITDVLLMALPLHILAQMTLTAPEKRGIAFIFLLALISIAAILSRFCILNGQGVFESLGWKNISQYYWNGFLTWLEIMLVEIAFVLPSLRIALVSRKKKRSSGGGDVMMISLVEEDRSDVLADREDAEVEHWRFRK